jgi:hypothetical protein
VLVFILVQTMAFNDGSVLTAITPFAWGAIGVGSAIGLSVAGAAW